MMDGVKFTSGVDRLLKVLKTFRLNNTDHSIERRLFAAENSRDYRDYPDRISATKYQGINGGRSAAARAGT
jgi:hypothetical protein